MGLPTPEYACAWPLSSTYLLKIYFKTYMYYCWFPKKGAKCMSRWPRRWMLASKKKNVHFSEMMMFAVLCRLCDVDAVERAKRLCRSHSRGGISECHVCSHEFNPGMMIMMMMLRWWCVSKLEDIILYQGMQTLIWCVDFRQHCYCWIVGWKCCLLDCYHVCDAREEQ